jgi:GT2 family glycosyltransferase
MQLAMRSMVEIGIATKNRWNDLRNTLSKIAEFGLGDVRTIILDDGSDDPCPFDVSLILRKAELWRFSESKGYIVRRNQLAREMESKYYLSLDDDSFPVGGSLAAAIEFAESRDDVFCLSLPVYNPVTNQHQVVSLKTEPYKVRSFIGCGHLLERRRLLELGGYREELTHQGEEVEIAARAFQRGSYCYHFPNLQIHHLESNAGRNWHRMAFYGARNNVLWNDWFVPSRVKLIKQSRTLISRSILFLKSGRVGHAQGQIAGFRDTLRYRANRQQMSPALYKQWKRLPAH